MPKTTKINAQYLDHPGTPRSAPGAFWYLQGFNGEPDTGIHHTCPCGCGIISGINLKGDRVPLWTITGTRDKPTLAPSVGIHAWENNPTYPRRAEKEADGYHWHGWLRNGVWEVA